MHYSIQQCTENVGLERHLGRPYSNTTAISEDAYVVVATEWEITQGPYIHGRSVTAFALPLPIVTTPYPLGKPVYNDPKVPSCCILCNLLRFIDILYSLALLLVSQFGNGCHPIDPRGC